MSAPHSVAVSELNSSSLRCIDLQRYLAGGIREDARRQDFYPKKWYMPDVSARLHKPTSVATRNPAANGRQPIRHMSLNYTLNPSAVMPHTRNNSEAV